MGERILYLVRHGQCELEPPGRHADLHVRRLTALGRMQARLVARRLSALPISVIHHSTFLRLRLSPRSFRVSHCGRRLYCVNAPHRSLRPLLTCSWPFLLAKSSEMDCRPKRRFRSISSQQARAQKIRQAVTRLLCATETSCAISCAGRFRLM